MFNLVAMKDTLRIPPWLFHLKLEEAVVEILNKKFANKVVHKVGLCITLWDVTKIEDSFIFPGDGSSHTVVHFRFVVFRPYSDEILLGKIKSSSKEGIHVTMGFFDDIIIPCDALQHPSRFDEAEQLFIWEYQTDEGAHDLFMEIGDELRFRVADEIFVDTTPNAPEVAATADPAEGEPEVKKSPYTIIGSMHEPGLGLLSWWNT